MNIALFVLPAAVASTAGWLAPWIDAPRTSRLASSACCDGTTSALTGIYDDETLAVGVARC